MRNAMITICENKICTYHIPLAISRSDDPYVNVFKDGGRVRVERHLYAKRDGVKVFLCDVCHAAVEMVTARGSE